MLVLSFLPAELLEFSPLAIEFGLIAVDLTLLLCLSVLLPLELISDQCPGAEPEQATDRSSCAGMTRCGADNSAGCGATQRADSGALFPGREAASGATDRGHDR
jgi:hypothetical protein